MMKDLRQNNGSSSILVIILLVVLLVFGVAVLTTALSNQRLAQKKQQWVMEYYQLEGNLMEELASYDRILIETANQARDYIESDAYVMDYPSADISDENVYNAIYKATYYHYVIENLNEAIQSIDTASLYINSLSYDDIISGMDLSIGSLSFQVVQDSEPARYLTMSIDLLLPTDIDVSRDGNMIYRYSIARLNQSQELQPLDEGIEFEDPFENPFE